ncbi:RES family NAD+ phosphorylase [candidate division WOR-3 bacterium]|nr:RES family NAD+ phosphorylase [candidate division WOR-3 bacterium]
MKITSWRIVKKKFEATAFSGEGARIYGGRWNSSGKKVVYTSENISLALLEITVHLDKTLLENYVLIPVIFENSMVKEIDPKILPNNWRKFPAPSALRNIGDDWYEENKFPVLKVPSVIVPSEFNYLLNVSHKDFKKMRMGISEPFEIDSRLKNHISR